jgi:hypothetical protein
MRFTSSTLGIVPNLHADETADASADRALAESYRREIEVSEPYPLPVTEPAPLRMVG